ncbi:MAG: shikimate kinase [Burkholderiaceae bacterium]|jgi:shikimate kinase|nr:shikimate kinase [Betaproteobacteria bacterium]
MTTPPLDPNSQPIALIGMMGSGKSTVGKRLARALNRPFLDADSELERRCGVPIQTIFELEGEEGFRQRESELLRGLIGSPDLVLATGGGAVLRPENQAHLRQHCCVIYLQASLQDLWMRLRHDRSRPLLKAADPKARIAELLRFREPIYQSLAHYAVPTGRQAPERVVQDIMRMLDLR